VAYFLGHPVGLYSIALVVWWYLCLSTVRVRRTWQCAEEPRENVVCRWLSQSSKRHCCCS